MTIDVNPDWWKTMFDEVYLQTDARSVCDDDLTRREIDVVLEMLPITPDHKILDLCGGHGRHSFELCARGFKKCTVLDFSSILIDRAKSRAAECDFPVDFICGDARSTGLLSESFDHVMIMGNSLGYILSDRADRRIMTEAYRVLNSGGWFLVDIADGEAIKQSFLPISWHEIGTDMVVCRHRELEEKRLAAREMVLSKKTGLIRDRNYALNLYDAKTLSALFSETGFSQVFVRSDFSPYRTSGDYGFMNCRMICIGQKP